MRLTVTERGSRRLIVALATTIMSTLACASRHTAMPAQGAAASAGIASDDAAAPTVTGDQAHADAAIAGMGVSGALGLGGVSEPVAGQVATGSDAGVHPVVPAGQVSLVAASSGTLEVFVDGFSAGKTTLPGEVLTTMIALPLGVTHSLAVHANDQATKTPYVRLQVSGAFGKTGSSTRWKATAATGEESINSTNSWTTPQLDDSAWPRATAVDSTIHDAAFSGGPARAIWSSSNADASVLLRTRLYVPESLLTRGPTGFGNAASGGDGGEVVKVSTRETLVSALAGDSPRILELTGVIDFTGSEGKTTSAGCFQKQCPAPLESELITNQLGACDSAGVPTFPVTLDKAGTKPITVGSNKTILGVGADAVIKGKGLSLSGGVSNIIIRNLAITDINPQVVWGGDALTIDDASRIWIDHVRVSRIGRQMLVTGFGAAREVTVSFSEFDGQTPYAAYCDGAHYWVWLILGANDSLSFVSNWIHHTSGRAPHAGGMKDASNVTHLLNNYYEDVLGHAVNPLTPLAKILLEGNNFERVRQPIQLDTRTPPGPGLAFAPMPSASAMVDTACKAALGRVCEGNLAAPQSGPFPLDQGVLDAFGATPADPSVVPYPANAVPDVVPHFAGPGHI